MSLESIEDINRIDLNKIPYKLSEKESFNPQYSIVEETFDSMKCRCSCAPSPGPYCGPSKNN